MKITFKILFLAFFLGSLHFLIGCKNEDPVPENIPELITKVILKFTPVGGPIITVTATDPDGDGPQDLEIDGPINLSKETTYTLTIELINGLYDQGANGYDVSKEVRAEGDEHQLFFSWTNGVFSSPSGTGNIGSAPDTINYEDEDANGLPIGLTTSWTTSADSGTGKSLRILLKHQPDIKSKTSTSLDGESDLDISFFPLNVN